MFSRLLFWGVLAVAASYILRVAPDVRRDPGKAIHTAYSDVTTFCDREKTICEVAGSAAENALQAGKVAFAVLTGKGTIKYVPYEQEAEANCRPGRPQQSDNRRSPEWDGLERVPQPGDCR